MPIWSRIGPPGILDRAVMAIRQRFGYWAPPVPATPYVDEHHERVRAQYPRTPVIQRVILMGGAALDVEALPLGAHETPEAALAEHMASVWYGFGFGGGWPNLVDDWHGPFERAALSAADYRPLNVDDIVRTMDAFREESQPPTEWHPEPFRGVPCVTDLDLGLLQQVLLAEIEHFPICWHFQLTEGSVERQHEFGNSWEVYREFLFWRPGGPGLRRVTVQYN